MAKKTNCEQSSPIITRLIETINSPLKTLSLSSQKLLDTYKEKNFEYISYKDFKHLLLSIEQMNKQIQRCYQSAQRLTGLDQDNIKVESVDINEVIVDVLKHNKFKLSEFKIKPQIRLAQGLAKVKLNRIDGHQIIQNIISNSIQAMPAGGRISIKTSYNSKTHLVSIHIFDDGVGISQQRLARIFEPFFTTKEQGIEKSSGLGLSIVYAIVKGVGGSINIQSSLRKGTQVEILLPAA